MIFNISLQGNFNIVELLLSKGANPFTTSHSGVNLCSLVNYASILDRETCSIIKRGCINHAINFGLVDSMMVVLRANPGLVNESTSTGWTPLISAVESGDIDAVRDLLVIGSDVNAQEADGWTGR